MADKDKTKSKYEELSEKYKLMKENRQKYNTIDITDFLPTLDEMLKEDCAVDLLSSSAKNINENHDAIDFAYYASKPFSEEPGYYRDNGIFVLDVKQIANKKGAWELNNYDGDTLYFYLDDLDIGGDFKYHGSTYSSFKNYIEKQCGSSDRNTVGLRFAGINCKELPHYEATLIYNEDKIEKKTIKQLKDLKAGGTSCAFVDYTITKKDKNDPSSWTIKEKDENAEIEVYVKDDGYYEIVKDMDATKYLDGDLLSKKNKYLPKVIVSSNSSTKDTVKDAYNAQYKLQNLFASNKVRDMKLVIDAESQVYTRTYPTYTIYQSLYKSVDNIKNLIQSWIDAVNGIGIPQARLNYRPFGTDAYGRIFGTLYLKINTDAGDVWIDASKFTMTNSEFTELGEDNDLGEGFKNTIGLNSYSQGHTRYVDNLDEDGVDSYNKKIELHKELTGIDFTKMKDCTVMIGDFLFLIPPQSIRNVNNMDYERLPVMRGKGTMTKNNANREQLMEIDLFFYGEAGINGIPYEAELPNGNTVTYYMNGLRALIAQFRLTPFLPIENNYINDVLGIEAVALVNFNLSTVDNFPKLLKATLTLRDFNYRIYMPTLPISYYSKDENIESLEPGHLVSQIFGKVFEWELFRFYYQRSIIHGEEMKDLDFNSFEYGDKFYTCKNTFQRNNLTDNFMEFYIPDEKWLSSALEYKKAIDYTGQTVMDVELSESDHNFMTKISNLKDYIFSYKSQYSINSLNADMIDANAKIFVSDTDTSIKNFDSIDKVPNFEGYEIVKINNNIPTFNDTAKNNTTAFKNFRYMPDGKRPGYAYANVCIKIMPEEGATRGEIGHVKPPGWSEVKYDHISGKHLYNRCHLIGWQLCNEDDNEKNLITGTKNLNNNLMLPYENLVAKYVRATENHVLYRVTPKYIGEELVARGVQIEAWSVEDKGKGICFNIFLYNVQPQVSIDYATGESQKDKDSGNLKNDDSENLSIDKYKKKDIINGKVGTNLLTNGSTNSGLKSGQDIIIKDIKNGIVEEIEKSPIVKSVRIDEEYNGDGTLYWPLVIKLNTSECSDLNNIRENIKNLTNAKSIKDCLVDESIVVNVVANFNGGKYISGSASVEYGDELKAIRSAYKDDDDEDEENDFNSTNNSMFDYTKYKDPRYMKFVPFMTDENGNSKILDVDEISFSMSNTFTELRLKATDGYAPQYMGGSDVTVECKFTMTEGNVVYELNNLPAKLTQMTKTYRRVMPCQPLKVKNSYLQTLGLNEMLLDSIQIDTVEGFPGVYSVHIRMTSVDRSLRQREMISKLNSTGTTTTITNASITNMFALNDELAKAELYPDLDLPTVQELADNGWGFLKYVNENRLFVDPDFYIIYSFKYTSQLTKELLRHIYEENLTDEALENFKESNAYIYEDSMGIQMESHFDSVVGSSWKNCNDYSQLYDEIIETVDEAAQNEKLKNKLSKEAYKDTKEYINLGTTLEYLTATGIFDGWNTKSGYPAVLPDEATDIGVKSLEVSELDYPTENEEDKTNQIYKDIYDIRAEAISYIDDILSKEISYSADEGKILFKTYKEDNPVELCKFAVLRVFKDGGSGEKLAKLLNGGNPVESFNFSSLDGQQIYSKTWEKEMEEPNFLKYVTVYLLGISYAYNFSPAAEHGFWNWKGTIDGYEKDLPYQFDKEGNPYCEVKDTELQNVQIKLNRSDINGDWEKYMDEIQKAGPSGCFGINRIRIYSLDELKSMLEPEISVKYKYDEEDMTKMYVKEDEDVFCQDNAFIDPYYNKAGHRSQKGKKYKECILRYQTCNYEAQLRIVLMYLKRLIIEGYFFSEIDVVAKDLDSLKEVAKEVNSNIGKVRAEDEIKKGDIYKKSSEYKVVTEEVDDRDADEISVDMTNEILKVLPDTFKKAYCARMIYPFIAAACEYDENIMKDIKERNIQTLNSKVSSVTGITTTPKNMFDKYLASLNFLSVVGVSAEEENGSKGSTTVSQKVNNLLMQEAFTSCANDPRQYVMHSFYDMCVNDKRGRLLRAFPTYYIVFIDEGRKIGSWKLYDNFYNMSSISELQIVKSRKIPADTFKFTMSNLYMSYAESYDNSIYQQYVDVYSAKDVVDSLFNPLVYLTKEEMVRNRKQLKDTAVIVPGVRIHARIGYGADASKIPIAFNGKVAELEVGEAVEVVCQGDGHELSNPLNALGELNAKSFQTSQHWITWFKDIRGSFMRGGESPRNLAAKLLNAEYNQWKKIFRDYSHQRFFADNPFGIYHFGDRRYQDIFSEGETVQNLYEVTNGALLMGYNTLINDKSVNAATPIINCSLQDKSYWEILNMCANSGDNYFAAIRDFGFRSTVCLCRGNHYYAYEYRKHKNNVYEKRKPFQQFHYYDSYNDIIYNTIKATEKNLKTNAVGTWQTTSAVWGTSQDTVGPIYLDMNIYPEYQKSMTVDTGLVGGGDGGFQIGFATHFAEQWDLNEKSTRVNKTLAEKVTTNVLKNSVKDMYEGELCVIGDPSIKPFDEMCFIDTYENMNGTVEVETVIHNFNATTGFTTTIVPDLIVSTDSIQPRAGKTMILGKFIPAASAIISFAAAGHVVKNLPEYVTTLAGTVTGKIAELAKSIVTTGILKTLGVDTAAKFGWDAINLVSGAFKTTPLGLVTMAVTAVATFGFVQNLKDSLYRTLRNIQALTVFPIYKNNRALVAGMAGHKGSVFGYQQPNGTETDSIQWMIIHFYEKIPGFLKGTIGAAFASDYDYEGIMENWKANLSVEKNKELYDERFTPEKNRMIFMNDVFDTFGKEFSSRAAYIQSLKTKPRITKFNTSNKTTEEYLRYQIGGIYDDPDKEEYSNLPESEKTYIKAEDLSSNKRLCNLCIVEEDEEIKLAMEGSHSVIKEFTFSHSSKSAVQAELIREAGNRTVNYLVDKVGGYDDKDVFDFPMLQEEAITLIKVIINNANMEKCNLNFASGTRVNDTRSWKSTGFSFSLSSEDNYDNLKKAVEETKSDTTWYGEVLVKDHKGKTFDYATSSENKTIAITVYAPIE